MSWRDYPCILVKPNTAAGYRKENLYGITYYCHRAAFLKLYGYCPRLACHHCDTPNCVQGYHIFDGTSGDNLRDASAKGLLRRVPVDRVRDLLACGVSHIDIANHLHIGTSTVHRIAKGRRPYHV